MGFILLLLFIGVPVIEIAVFIQVGDVIGLWPTLIIVILTAVLGTHLLRQQGLSTLMRAQSTINEGRVPAEEMFDGICLVLAGAFLLTPGFVTDTVGFLLFFPPFRAFMRKHIKEIVLKRGNVHVVGPDGRPIHPHNPQDTQKQNSKVIDADFEEIDPNPDSPWSEKKD